jgi:hypothetical protein
VHGELNKYLHDPGLKMARLAIPFHGVDLGLHQPIAYTKVSLHSVSSHK